MTVDEIEKYLSTLDKDEVISEINKVITRWKIIHPKKPINSEIIIKQTVVNLMCAKENINVLAKKIVRCYDQ